MEVPLEKIKIPDRIREDLGDLEGLRASLRDCGQLNPVALTDDFTLIAGHRRLECARQLGWDTIDARIIDGTDALRQTEMELQENLHRKDFTPEELARGLKRLEKLRNPPFYRRFAHGVRALLRKLCFWRRR